MRVDSPWNTHKYVDDTTLTEITAGGQSCMQTFLDTLSRWSEQNDMVISSSKTKEMILGRRARSHQQTAQLSTGSGPIERVSNFKLLGVFIGDALTWNAHIDYITKKHRKEFIF